MLSSLLLSLALGWLTNFDGSDCPCVTLQATYEVGCCDDSKDCKDASCKACCQEACKVSCEASCKSCCDEDCMPADMVMCGSEPVEMAKAQEKAVVVQFRIVQTPERLLVGNAIPVFLNAQEVQGCLGSIQVKGHGKVVSSPTLILCSDQVGSIEMESPCVSDNGKCDSACTSSLGKLSLAAKPCISADGNFIRLHLECSTLACPENKGSCQESRVHTDAVLRDGMTIALPGTPCTSKNGSSEHFVIMATVRIADDKGHPVATSTTCTRECPASAMSTSCCEDCSRCDTVECNLAKLQKASELCKLAELYERLNQCETAGKILVNVTQMCPGSRIACQAEDHCKEMLISQSERLSEIQKEWEKIWFTDMPSHLVAGTISEESETPAKCSKLDQVLCSYRKACSEGNNDRARQLAIEALALDPTCFAK